MKIVEMTPERLVLGAVDGDILPGGGFFDPADLDVEFLTLDQPPWNWPSPAILIRHAVPDPSDWTVGDALPLVPRLLRSKKPGEWVVSSGHQGEAPRAYRIRFRLTPEIHGALNVWLDMLEERGFHGFGDERAAFTYQPLRCAACHRLIGPDERAYFGPGAALKCEPCGPWTQGEWTSEVGRQRPPSTTSERVSAARRLVRDRSGQEAYEQHGERSFEPQRIATLMRSADPRQRLTRELVIWARSQVLAGRSTSDLAREIGVAVPTLVSAVNGTTWTDVTEVPPVKEADRPGGILVDRGSPVLQALYAAGLRPGDTFTTAEAAEALGIGTQSAAQSLVRLTEQGYLERLSHGGPRQPSAWKLI